MNLIFVVTRLWRYLNIYFLKPFDAVNDTITSYLIYNKHEYLINRYKSRTFTSFFILKKNKDSTGSNYVILDHFGSSEISSKHLSYLIKEKNKLIFLSKKKIYKSNHKLINYINLKIGFLKKINIKEKSKFLINKEIFLGDTDSFITI